VPGWSSRWPWYEREIVGASMTQTVEESEWDGTRFGREQTTGVMLGLGWPQVIFLGIGAVLMLLWMLLLPAPISVIFAVLTAGIFAGLGLPKKQGMPFVVYLWHLVRYGRRGAADQLRYVQRNDAEALELANEP